MLLASSLKGTVLGVLMGKSVPVCSVTSTDSSRVNCPKIIEKKLFAKVSLLPSFVLNVVEFCVEAPRLKGLLCV